MNTWTGTYGVTAAGSSLRLNFVTHGPYSTNIGSRVYLLDDNYDYMMFHLKNKEFTFDVDVSNLPCGINGALYFSEMMKDGGSNEYSGNKAGAKYGTGYCDAQCPHDIKFINGEGNSEGWVPSKTDVNSGTGKYGTCCQEMDIWEANETSSAYTAHVCTVDKQTRCEGIECGDTDKTQRYQGVCDKDGCDFNAYRLGTTNFFGSGSNFQIDTTRPFTVVTQFITEDGTDTGDLKEIKRLWVQDGKVIQNPSVQVNGDSYNSLTDEFCNAEKKTFGDINDFEKKGGIKAMGGSFDESRGMVLVMSLWDDHDVNMLWLDSSYPTDKDPSTPGVTRGPCSVDSGKPSDVESQHPDAHVIYSNIKYGELNSTYNGSGSTCPGGSLTACIGQCPSDPSLYKACVQSCVAKCSSNETE